MSGSSRALRSAVVIGSGPNGLVAAITLASAGLAVELHEEADALGGALRSAGLTLPGFVHDVCSAVHPLARSSPAFRALELEIDWVDPPAPAAHPFDDGTAALLEHTLEGTAAGLGEDGAAYRRLVGPIVDAWSEIEPIVLGPYPPGAAELGRLVRGLGQTTLHAVRAGLAAAAPLARSHFRTDRARGFFAAHAAHSILPLERRPSAAFGLALCALGHVAGWPVPRGGAQRIADVLAARLRELGGVVRTGSRIDELPRADVVLADVMPRELVRLAQGRLPDRYERALLRYRHGPGALKLDWALSEPIPWSAPDCSRAGTIHLGGTLDEIAASERAPWQSRVEERPFVLLAQPSLFDPTRAPAGQHTAWAYCHVPNGYAGDLTEQIEAQVERFAPGFARCVLARRSTGPADMERGNRNLVGGDLNGGAMDLPQVFFRPVRQRVPYRTPLPGVYLCSSATPPGGGVHGMSGLAAALTALRDENVRRSGR